MAAPSISVVTVAYNSAGTISDTLRSVAEQTYPNLEHIVVDGASTDDTMRIVQRHATGRTIVLSERDRGIYDAMNKGIRLATGDFVGFLNADDVFANRHVVADIAQVAGSAASVDAVYGDLVYVEQDRPDQFVRYWRSGVYSRSNLRLGWMPPHPTLYVRRSRLLQVGDFDTSFRISADYDFMLRFLSAAQVDVRYLAKVLVQMRTGGASNRSVGALIRKSSEDLRALQKNRVGGVATLLCKNVRKLPQFFGPAARACRG